jgi:flagellar biosynthetic protein FliQ
MTPEFVVHIVRDALMVTFWLSVPILMVGFTVGIIMSLIQIVTSIQDSAFNTVPRLAAVLAALVLAMPWMLSKATTYAASIFGNLSRYAQ